MPAVCRGHPVTGTKIEASFQYRYYCLRSVQKDECKNKRMHYRACRHPKDINAFG